MPVNDPFRSVGKANISLLLTSVSSGDYFRYLYSRRRLKRDRIRKPLNMIFYSWPIVVRNLTISVTITKTLTSLRHGVTSCGETLDIKKRY